MPALEGSGTQTATIGTEHTLASLTTFKTFVGFVDLSAMQAGDAVEKRVKIKVLGGGTLRTVLYERYEDAQPVDDAIVFTLPILSDIQWDLTLKQVAGTGRAFPWKALSA